MKMYNKLLSLTLGANIFLCLSSLGEKYSSYDTLIVDQPASKLHIAKWFKGAPVLEYKKGMTYLFEFTEFACPPCRKKNAEFSRIAEKYGDKLTVTRVYGYGKCTDQPFYEDQLEAFVKENGDRIGFNAAMDDFRNYTIDDWKCSGGSEVIIDRNGNVAWINRSPWAGAFENLSDIVGKIIDGKWTKEMANAEKKSLIQSPLS